jgi:hypothetical protein
MTVIADYTSSGWIVGLGILGAFMLGFAIWAVVGALFMRSRDTRRMGFWNIFAALVCAVLVFLIWLAANWPLKYEYHHYVEKTGVVSNIGNRMVSGGEGIVNQRYVFVINGYPYGVDDTRASLAKKGDTVTLYCKKEHEFGQQFQNDGYGCRWGKATK